MSEPSYDPRKQGLQTPVPTIEPEPVGNPAVGAALSFFSLILLAYILRLAVPKEDNAIELGVLLIAAGFAQIWLIFYILKSFRK